MSERRIQIIAVPYDSGHKEIRMGRGPGHFLQRGLENMLRHRGHEVQSEQIDAPDEFQAEIESSFTL